MSTQQDINAFRAQRIANTHDPLALMANTQTPCHPDHSSLITYIQHPQPNNNFVPQPSFNTNYMPQPMQNLEDSSDPTTAMNKALALLAKAFKVNTIPTNNNQRSSLIPRNSQIAQQDMNTSQDIKMQMVDDNVGNQVRHNAVQNDGNEVGQNAVQNPAPAEGNDNGINGNSISNSCRLLKRKKQGSKALKRNQASTSGTRSDNAPVYDSDGSTEVSKTKGTTKGMRTNTMFTKQSILGKPPSSSSSGSKLYSVTPFPKSSVLPKVDKTNALSKPVTSNSAPSTRELKVVQIFNVIAPRIFRTNPSKTSRVDNVIPNKPAKTSVRIKPITVSQPNVIHKQQVNSDLNGFSSTRVNNTAKTRKPHPRRNSNTDRVPSNASTSNPSEPSSKGFPISTSLLGSYAFSDSLLLTPLCCDDIHDVTPRISALAGCDTMDRALALQEALNPFKKIYVCNKMISFLGSLPVPLKNFEWISSYSDSFVKKVMEMTLGTHDYKPSSFSPPKRTRQHETVEEAMLPRVHHDFIHWGTSNKAAKTKYNTNLARLLPKQIYSPCIVDWGVLNNMGCAEEIKAMLEIKFARRLGLYHAAEISEEGFEVYFQGGLCGDENFNARDYWLSIISEEELHLSRSLASSIRCPILRIAKRSGLLTDEVLDGLSDLVFWRALDAIIIRELIGSNGRLIAKDPAAGVLRVAMPRPPRPSMQDLYDRMGNMEIRKGVLEGMSRRQLYHTDRYASVFEHLAGHYGIPLQGPYAPPSYEDHQE
ncbi:hypothetical protein Tco_1313483 [Tanacetum coccineum]